MWFGSGPASIHRKIGVSKLSALSGKFGLVWRAQIGIFGRTFAIIGSFWRTPYQLPSRKNHIKKIERSSILLLILLFLYHSDIKNETPKISVKYSAEENF